MPPPTCSNGFRPEVDGACWTGACIPEQLCNHVTDCSYCGADEICYEFGGWTPHYECHPRPQACGSGPVDCACASDPCDAKSFQCGLGSSGADLNCFCPNC
jgi:hypothetical protein